MQIKHSTLSDRIRERRPEQTSSVLGGRWKEKAEGAFRTCCGRAFQARAAATGNNRSPRVERRVDACNHVLVPRVLVVTAVITRDYTQCVSGYIQQSAGILSVLVVLLFGLQICPRASSFFARSAVNVGQCVSRFTSLWRCYTRARQVK